MCGEVSENLECIDVDSKNHPDPEAFLDAFFSELMDYYGGEGAIPLVVTFTPSGGVHLWYRCETIESSKKIANIVVDDKELCIIETRGEGGYALAPPSEGYTFRDSNFTFDKLREISPDEREDLLEICRSFNEVLEVEKPVRNISSATYKNAPWDEYNNDLDNPFIDVLIKHGWEQVFTKGNRIYFKRPGSENKFNANFHIEKRIFYVFTSSTKFSPNHGYTPFSVFKILEHDGDSSKAAKAARKMGYGQVWNNEEEVLIKNVAVEINKGKMFREIIDLFGDLKLLKQDNNISTLEKIEAASVIKARSESGIFWDIGRRGAVTLNYNRFMNFLKSDHSDDPDFKKPWRLALVHSSSSYRMVVFDEVKRQAVNCNLKTVKDYCFEWVQNFDFSEYDVTMGEVMNVLLKLSESAWTSIIEGLPTNEMDDFNFLRDKKEASFHFFKNCIVKVTRDGAETILYEDLDADTYVWKDKINERSFSLVEYDHIAKNTSYFFKFIKRLSAITPEMDMIKLPDLRKDYPEEHKRLMSFMTTIGYLCTNYKDPSHPYAVIFTEDTARDGQGGGTGKGLLMKAISYVRNVTFIDGKTWSPDKSFAWQRVDIDTDIVSIEDVSMYFKFGKLYNVITDGIDIEKKRKDSFFLDYSISPKVSITTNYAILRTGNHASRRGKELLFHPYYNKNVTPKSESHEKNFFYDWDAQDWNMFYRIIFECIQMYYNYGVIEFGSTERTVEKEIKIKAGEHGEDFYSFMSEMFSNFPNDSHWYGKKELWKQFLDEHEIDKKDVGYKRFYEWVETFCEKQNIEVSYSHNRDQSGGIDSKFRIITFNVRKSKFAPGIIDISDLDNVENSDLSEDFDAENPFNSL